MKPETPKNYTASIEITFLTLAWENGAGAVSVRHEISEDGVSWSRLDDDQVPTVTSDHSLYGVNKLFYLRAKSINADGESAYTPVIEVTTGEYIP